MGWSFEEIDWSASAAGAAWVQAVLTVGAVAGAAWLQDRGIRRRAEAEQVSRLESVAAIARFAHYVFNAKFKDLTDGMDPGRCRNTFAPQDVTPALRAVREVRPLTLGDPRLVEDLLHMEYSLSTAQQLMETLHETAIRCESGGHAVNALSMVGSLPALALQSAVEVERRVAALTGRKPHL